MIVKAVSLENQTIQGLFEEFLAEDNHNHHPDDIGLSCTCSPGQWYAAYYPECNYWFVGLATAIQVKSVVLDFLQQKSIGSNAFTHMHEDIKTLPTSTVFHKLEVAPEPLSPFRYDTLCLNEGDFSLIQRVFKEKYLK